MAVIVLYNLIEELIKLLVRIMRSSIAPYSGILVFDAREDALFK